MNAVGWKVGGALLALAGLGQAQSDEFPELGLTLTLPELEGLQQTRRAAPEQTRCTWTGTYAGAPFRMDLIALPVAEFSFREAGDVTGDIVDYYRGSGDFDVDAAWYHTGAYGFAPILSVVSGRGRDEAGNVAEQFIAGGLVLDFGYALYVRIDGELSEEDREPLLDFFEHGIEYDGEERDPEWTLAELEARWLRDAPDDLHADFQRNLTKSAWLKKAVVRTKNYVILTNASGGKLFAKKMEENLKEIRKVFPFEEVEGRRLMPVFLFRTREEYNAFQVKVTGASREAANRSKGHAWRDYYATWYEAPKDPVHIHEQVHQVFANRLRLSGGGSWFQEGVAEYIESSANDRNMAAKQVESGKHMPLEEFFQIRSLLWSSSEDRPEGGSEAGDLYKQAAVFIEFLRESKWGKGKFESFLESMGRVPRNDLEKVRAVFTELYGASLEELEAAFREYCEDR